MDLKSSIASFCFKFLSTIYLLGRGTTTGLICFLMDFFNVSFESYSKSLKIVFEIYEVVDIQ